MDIKEFKAGAMKNGAGYNYFLPKKINHSYALTDENIYELQDKKIKFQLRKLEKEGIIMDIGPDGGGHWEVGE
jgi:predicted HTH transcriptional regulator